MSERRNTPRKAAPFVWRVQSADGRGPWRPGFSKHWIDNNSDWRLPEDVLSAFGLDWRDEIPQGWHAGCACRTWSGLMRWFTPTERQNLAGFGFMPTGMYVDRVIRENKDQVVFVRKLKLNDAAIALPWDLSELEAEARAHASLRGCHGRAAA